jgi:2-dehydro-3-deoxyphosphogluconate aldolase/(4S)-4-hydroxy-2-oxoglutarate aldolase
MSKSKAAMTREEVCARIREIGVIPGIRASKPEDAILAAEAVAQGGIPIVEVTMTVPGALEVIATLVKQRPEVIVGAGTVWGMETAKKCLDAGAQFLTSTGLDVDVVNCAKQRETAVLPGALTPTEVMMAWRAGADFVKVFPCAQMGGASYIRALKNPFPQVELIGSGGVNQQNVAEFVLAGAAAVAVGAHLIPRKAIELRQPHRIIELAMRFAKAIEEARTPMKAF